VVSLGQGIARVAVDLVDTNDAASASQSGSITSNDRVASSRSGRISTAPSNSPMPDLYPSKAVSKEDCAALASHARNRLQSDRNDPCQDSRRHFPFVAYRAVIARLLRWEFVEPKQNFRVRSSRPATRLSFRGSSSLAQLFLTAPIRPLRKPGLFARRAS